MQKVKIPKASDQPDDGKPGSTAPATKAPAGTKVKNVNLPRTIGKVFFVDNKGEHHWCSATSIQSRHRNLVATAGHCVYENGKDDVYEKWVFVPGYYQGKAPWGIYAAPTPSPPTTSTPTTTTTATSPSSPCTTASSCRREGRSARPTTTTGPATSGSRPREITA